MKNTRVHKGITRAFNKAGEPVSAKELLVILKASGLKPNKTTVYRQLDKLEEQKIIRRVQFEEGTLKYEKTENHHHHLICNTCKKVEDIIIKENFLEKAVARKNFMPINHQLEIFGICNKCTS